MPRSIFNTTTRTPFPNLARRDAQKQIADNTLEAQHVTRVATEELETARVPKIHEIFLSGEVPAKCMGDMGPWCFQRAWYYWVITGAPVPYDVALEIYNTAGKVVRDEGCAGGKEPRPTGTCSWHVDTIEGLTYLVAELKRYHESASDPKMANPYSEDDLREAIVSLGGTLPGDTFGKGLAIASAALTFLIRREVWTWRADVVRKFAADRAAADLAKVSS